MERVLREQVDRLSAEVTAARSALDVAERKVR